MTEPGQTTGKSETGREGENSNSLRLALARTDLAFIRTGFSTAAFGAGFMEVLGRGAWPDLWVDALMVLFLVAGILSVQVGLGRLIRRSKDVQLLESSQRFEHYLFLAAAVMLQIALTLVLLLVLFV